MHYLLHNTKAHGCTRESLARREVLSYFAYVTVTLVYVGQPLVVAASRNRTLLNGVAAHID